MFKALNDLSMSGLREINIKISITLPILILLTSLSHYVSVPFPILIPLALFFIGLFIAWHARLDKVYSAWCEVLIWVGVYADVVGKENVDRLKSYPPYECIEIWKIIRGSTDSVGALISFNKIDQAGVRT
jgi:hypothetical protein